MKPRHIKTILKSPAKSRISRSTISDLSTASQTEYVRWLNSLEIPLPEEVENRPKRRVKK